MGRNKRSTRATTRPIFTSLRYPVERLQEAEYFLGCLVRADQTTFQFNLNAFLGACFNSIEMTKRSLAGAAGFREWMKERLSEMQADDSMRFFMSSRNYMTHEGPVPYVAGANRNHSWSFVFVDRRGDLPAVLDGREVRDCCAVHLTRLATMVSACAERFPFHACPSRAYTSEGMQSLGYSLEDAVIAAGFPSAWAVAGASIPISEALRLLRREIEPLDILTLRRLAAGDFRRGEKRIRIPRITQTDLLTHFAARLSSDAAPVGPRAAFIGALAQRFENTHTENPGASGVSPK
jgi:hypothetical protein